MVRRFVLSVPRQSHPPKISPSNQEYENRAPNPHSIATFLSRITAVGCADRESRERVSAWFTCPTMRCRIATRECGNRRLRCVSLCHRERTSAVANKRQASVASHSIRHFCEEAWGKNRKIDHRHHHLKMTLTTRPTMQPSHRVRFST